MSEPVKITPRGRMNMEAQLVTGDNLDAVARWCNGHVVGRDIDLPEIQLSDERDPDYVDWARPGQYVIKGVTGRYWSMEPETFEKLYEVIS